MKKNNKGFSLIELLGILIILALLVLLISRPVLKMLSDTKEKISDKQEKSIKNAAEKWSIDNSDKFDDIEESTIMIGLDVLFILDVSGSMTGTVSGTSDKRYVVMANAFNDAATVLESELNRFAVVTYSTSASVFMPLDVYSSSNGKFLEATNATASIKSTTTLKKGSSLFGVKTASVTGSTYIQGGIYTGSKILLDNNDVTQRIPVVILLTDGAPGLCNKSTLGIYGDHSGAGTSTNNGEAMYPSGVCSIMAANYYKPLIQNHYNSKVFFYTVGVGILNGYFGELVLNPTKDNINNSTAADQGCCTVGQRKSLANWLKSNGGVDAWDYADKAYINTVSSADLRNAFSEIATTIQNAAKVTNLCITTEELYNDGYLSSKDIKLANDGTSAQYVLISYNEPTNQFGYYVLTPKTIAKDGQAAYEDYISKKNTCEEAIRKAEEALNP